MTTIHINRPECIDKQKRRRHCPTCEKRTTMVVFFYGWYGATTTCLACGEQWSDGERCERPFRPGWRQENIRDAKRLWQEVVPIGLDAWLNGGPHGCTTTT